MFALTVSFERVEMLIPSCIHPHGRLPDARPAHQVLACAQPLQVSASTAAGKRNVKNMCAVTMADRPKTVGLGWLVKVLTRSMLEGKINQSH